jgi:aminopeptidase
MYMLDPRITKLAENVVHFSIDTQPGEHVWIDYNVKDIAFAQELIRLISERGGHAHVRIQDRAILRAMLLHATEESIRVLAENDLALMKQMQGYITVSGSENISELSDVPADKMKLYSSLYVKPVHLEYRVNHTKWVLLRYPNTSMAQLANMSTAAFEKFYFDVCTMDYARMDRAEDALKALMDRTDKVRLVGPGTDLNFSIKGIGSVKCSGHRNIPDGEVFSAPVKDSVNGVVSYNSPSPYQGFVYDNVRLEFENGKIVKATANNTEAINKIFDTDEGARYVGEFAIGFNPYVTQPMKDILFDEKISGSFHFTPGQSLDGANNGNNSAIHWDLVCIQRPEFGGGEIWFDDVLIRKDGLFMLPELDELNPDQLKG